MKRHVLWFFYCSIVVLLLMKRHCFGNSRWNFRIIVRVEILMSSENGYESDFRFRFRKMSLTVRVHIIRMKIVLFVLCTLYFESTKYKKYNGSHPEAPKWNSEFCNFVMIDVLGFITQNPNVKMDAVLRSTVTVSWDESEHTHGDEQETDVIGSRKDISPSLSGRCIEIQCYMFTLLQFWCNIVRWGRTFRRWQLFPPSTLEPTTPFSQLFPPRVLSSSPICSHFLAQALFKPLDCRSTQLIPAPCHHRQWNLILFLIVLDLAIMIQILTLTLTMSRRTIQTVARNYATF